MKKFGLGLIIFNLIFCLILTSCASEENKIIDSNSKITTTSKTKTSNKPSSSSSSYIEYSSYENSSWATMSRPIKREKIASPSYLTAGEGIATYEKLSGTKIVPVLQTRNSHLWLKENLLQMNLMIHIPLDQLENQINNIKKMGYTSFEQGKEPSVSMSNPYFRSRSTLWGEYNFETQKNGKKAVVIFVKVKTGEGDAYLVNLYFEMANPYIEYTGNNPIFIDFELDYADFVKRTNKTKFLDSLTLM